MPIINDGRPVISFLTTEYSLWSYQWQKNYSFTNFFIYKIKSINLAQIHSFNLLQGVCFYTLQILFECYQYNFQEVFGMSMFLRQSTDGLDMKLYLFWFYEFNRSRHFQELARSRSCTVNETVPLNQIWLNIRDLDVRFA